LIGGVLLVLLIGILFYYFSPYRVAAMMAPPPAGHRFLFQPDHIEKMLYSRAAERQGLGSSGWIDANNSSPEHPIPVIRGEELTVEIKFIPGGGPGEDESPPRVRRLVENLPAGLFQYQSVSATSDGVDTDIVIQGNPGAGASQLIFNLNARPRQELSILILLKAVQYSGGAVKIEGGDSRIEFDSESMAVPDAWVLIRNLLGPVGDVYSHFQIDRRIAPEKEGVDVIAARQGIDPYFGQGVLWYRPNYNLQIKGYPYYKYYHYLKRRVTNRLKNEIAERIPNNSTVVANCLSDSSSDQPQVYLRSGRLDISGNGDLIVRGKKVVIVEGDLIIQRNLKFQAGDHNSQLAFIVNRGQIIIDGKVDSIQAYLLGDLRCSPAYSCQFQLAGWSDKILNIEGAVTARKIILGNRQGRVSFLYDARGVNGLPGISELLNPLAREIAP